MLRKSMKEALGCICLLGLVLLTTTTGSARTPGPLCRDGVVITGTPYTRVQLRQLAGGYVTPELIQAAALVASIDEGQQEAMLNMTWNALRRAGYGDDLEPLFLLLYGDAKSAHATAGVAKQVIAGTIGFVIGTTVTGKVSEALAYGGGAAETFKREGAVKLTEQALDGGVVDPILDSLVRNPCTISAEDALASLETAIR